MSILAATNVSQSFGETELFQGVNVTIHARDRIGLVGPNGVGKTTLLLILAGRQEPQTGTLTRARELKLGYLRQEAVLTFAGQAHTLFAEMQTAFADLQQLEARLRDLEAQMADGESGEAVLDEYGRLQQQYEQGGGYTYQAEIQRVLQGLGFGAEQWQTLLGHLSGGQKTRALLGRLLLEKPDLLILDEPTNHLDMTAVEWLERTLRTWPGALLIVSHDRYFLDRTVDQIWEMRRDGIDSYRGNYTAYVQQRQARWERESSLFLAEKERLTQELDWVRRHIAGGKTDMAKGRLRRLTRDIILIEQVGVLGKENKSWLEIGGRVRTFTVNEAEQRLNALRPPDNSPPRLNLKLRSQERSGRVALRARKLQIGYPNAPLFTCDKIRLEREDCAALIGPNGSGKTTLLRTLLGEIPPLAGDIFWGDNVQPGYFAQAHEQLNPANRVIDELRRQTEMEEPEARRHLAHYLFRGQDVFKRVRDLSGGERGRLALAILARQGANVLLLDEPTNHLDIPAQEAVQAVLEQFDGTVLLVSHDRYLVSRLATQIWELRDGRLHVFEGTYAAFLAARDGGETAVAELAAQAKVLLPETAVAPPPPPDLSWVQEIAPPPISARPRRKKRAKARTWQERVGQLDEALSEAEAWLAELELQLADAQATGDEALLARLQAEQAEAAAQLDDLMAEWEQLVGGEA